jgi:hypothetical protein
VREETARCWAAVVGRSAVFKVGARHGTARQRSCGGHMALGGQGPLAGGPRAEETTTDRWARSYLISI